MKKCRLIPIVMLLLLSSRSSFSQPLAPGDIAVLGFNSDQASDLNFDGFPDSRWAIVCLRDLPAGTVVIFTDAGYSTTGLFYVNANNEGHLTWTLTQPVPAGKVLAMDCSDGSNVSDLNGAESGNGGITDYGTVSGHMGGPTGLFAVSGDQIIIYQGTSGTTTDATFIYAYSTQQNLALPGPGEWLTTSQVVNQAGSSLPPGLTNGTTALALTNNQGNVSRGPGTLGTPNYGFNNMIYAGSGSGTQVELLSAIGNPANYIGDDATPYPIGIGTGFSITSDFSINAALPLTWGSLGGELKNGKALVQWETIQEMNTSHFDLETLIDGRQYIAQRRSIAAAGNSNDKRSYQYEFATNLSLIYARIKQVDIDGRYSYSKIITLKDDYTGTFQIINNPVKNGQIVFTVPDGWQEAKYSIFNSNGGLLKSGQLGAGSGGNKTVTLGNIPAGTYQLVIFDQIKTMSRQFIKL